MHPHPTPCPRAGLNHLFFSLWGLIQQGKGFPSGSDGKGFAYNAGDLGSIPGSARSPGEGNGNPLQCSCLENPMDRGAWWATVHGVAHDSATKQQHPQGELQKLAALPPLYLGLHSIMTPIARETQKGLVKWSEVAQSCPTLCNPMVATYQAPPSMGFSRQEYWSGLPFPSPGDLPDPGIEPRSPTSQPDA